MISLVYHTSNSFVDMSHYVFGTVLFLTHLLLTTFVASPFYTGLSSSIMLVFFSLSSTARTAFKLNTTPLPFEAPSRTWPSACRGDSPTSWDGVNPFHARMQGISVSDRPFGWNLDKPVNVNRSLCVLQVSAGLAGCVEAGGVKKPSTL